MTSPRETAAPTGGKPDVVPTENLVSDGSVPRPRQIPIVARAEHSHAGRLVLHRKVGETVRIGEDVTVVILAIGRSRVRIGIDAPRAVAILRGELVQPDLASHATSAPLPHVRDLGAQSPGSDVRAFLRELSAWCDGRTYRESEARDEQDRAYRRGWNAAIAHVREHALEHGGGR